MLKRLLFVVLFALSAFPAMAQGLTTACSNPPPNYGVVWTPGQWTACLSSFQAYLGYTPLNAAGGAMGGELILQTSLTNNAPLNFPPGSAPTLPVNGDLWFTSSGLFYKYSGGSIGPLIDAGGIPALAVTSITFGTTGLTPSSATNGTVTVAGTVNVAHGGTGAVSYTSHGILYGAGTSAIAVTAAGNNSVLVTDGSGIPSFATTLPTGINATTPSAADNTTLIATTAFVQTAIGATAPAVSWGGAPKTVNFNATTNTRYCIDTLTTGAVTMTLPGSPTDGAQVGFIDCKSNFAVVSFTVARNGNKIMGLTADMTVTTTNAAATMIYSTTLGDWRMY